MAQQMSRGEVQDLLTKFAAKNPQYRQALLSDPKGVVEKQFNTNLGSYKVKAVADTADTVHVVVPYVAGSGELSDADLERVAGGKGDGGSNNINANCNLTATGTASGNTVQNVNL